MDTLPFFTRVRMACTGWLAGSWKAAESTFQNAQRCSVRLLWHLFFVGMPLTAALALLQKGCNAFMLAVTTGDIAFSRWVLGLKPWNLADRDVVGPTPCIFPTATAP